jgi:hypothetical protein
MSIAEAIVEKLKTLPPDKQREVLDFATFLGERLPQRPPCRNVKGLLSKSISSAPSEQDMVGARQEMWGRIASDAA